MGKLGCLRCNPDRYPDPKEATKYYRGEVFEIQESVFTPIEEIFAKDSRLTGDALRRSRRSLRSIRTKEHATHKRRPGILMEYVVENAEIGVSNVWICIMATFEGTPIEDLPWIFRHFCMQVYTKNAAVVEDVHFHSLPDWYVRKATTQWIIMWPFKTTRGLGARWKETGGASWEQRATMVFGENNVDNLDKSCDERYLEWKKLCALRPGFAAEKEQEYRDYRKTWRESTAGSRTASLGSQESTAVSKQPLGYDAQSIISQIIYEDQVSVFNEKAQYAIYEPETRGPESVRSKRPRRRSRGPNRTSNTCSLASVNDGASVCGMGLKQRSPTREAFNNLAKRLAVVAPWGTA
ncbi:uncharacterized protein TRAVEDRAFT_74413 [Trametes versicolor FP-101664 SS1]|uniref:uncharacterized protein n=1 Tax=Trametes versicolor (strain FP-101664) TaxID=717944 RepID=UPI0004623200|nr:uncharacterized protein TRAVEDRAFT_74413 [Trametes versicolor FP-101664 SS1]EIW54188.1 hypothetical protein TRAVEDRAFT_74413 [Trametes versicolor FP-101664 SS1]